MAGGGESVSRVAFKQAEVQRLIRAAKAEGYPNAAVDKLPNGTLRLLTVPPAQSATAAPGEDDLDAELEAWRRDHGGG